MTDAVPNGVVTVVQRRVRTLLGDQRIDSSFIVSHLEIASDEMADKFQSYGLRFDTRVVVLSDVPANTADLSDYQVQTNDELFDLLVPESVDWKLAGQPEINWIPVTSAEVVSDTNIGPGTDQSSVNSSRSWIESYEWRGGTIFISPANVAVDLRVRGQFMPPFITSDAANPLRAALSVLTFATARSIAVTKGGPASALAKDFGARMINALGDFQSNQLKAQQTKPLRLGGRRTASGGSVFLPRFE